MKIIEPTKRGESIMNKTLLLGKTIIITEATKPTSLKVAMFTYRRGANIVLVDLDRKKLKAAIENLEFKKERLLLIESDLRNSGAANLIFQKVKEKFGFVNILYVHGKFYYDFNTLNILKNNSREISKKTD